MPEGGFEVVEAAAFPTAAATLERAIRQELIVSGVIIGQKPW
jgi:hypothetical protein